VPVQVAQTPGLTPDPMKLPFDPKLLPYFPPVVTHVAAGGAEERRAGPGTYKQVQLWELPKPD
jgi:hypothetical protein